MANILDHYKAIVDEMNRLSGLKFPIVDPNASFPLPRTIAVGNGQQIAVSETIDREIGAIAKLTRENDTAIRQSHTQKDWQTRVRRVFGIPLASLDLSSPTHENATKLKAEVDTALQNLKSKNAPPVTLVFGTSWLDVPDVTLQLGSARLETRVAWIARLLSEKKISKTTHNRLVRSWAGKNIRPRKGGWDQHAETSIANAVGSSSYVISVTLEGFSTEFAQDRAARIARLIHTVAALLWELPSSALRGLNLNYDDPPTKKTLLWIPQDGRVFASYNAISFPVGPRVSWAEWNKQVHNKGAIFRQTGMIADYIAGKARASIATDLVRMLDIAFRWFYEGCRASENLMAVTHFAAMLDTLAGGKKESGIVKLLETQLQIKKDTKILNDGRTTTQVVREIYSTGRSQFIHGSTKGHLHDWAEMRGIAERLCREVLLECLFRVDANANLQDFLTPSSTSLKAAQKGP